MAALFGCYVLIAAGIAVSVVLLRRTIDLASFVLFLILPLIFLYPGFVSGRTPIPLDHLRAQFSPWNAAPHPYPHNPALNDVVTQFVPWAKAVRMAYREGSVPFWDRWNGCGTPLGANGESAPFSPFTALMLALPLANAFVLLGAVKLLLALCGTYFWLIELGASRTAARFGAVTFAFSFAMTPWLYHPATADICLWPWVLFAIELLQDSRVASRAFGSLVLLLAVWSLCGHLETVALGALFGGLWWAVRALCGDVRKPAAIFGKIFLAGLLAVGLSAFSLVPQLHAVAASNRIVLASNPSHLNYVPWVPYRPGWLGGFVTSLFPTAFGDLIEAPMIPGAAGSIIEMGFGFIGVVGWSVALLILRPGVERSVKEFALLGLVIIGLGTAMGLPVFRTVAETLPGIQLAPPLRLLILVAMAGAALAALEVDRLLKDAVAKQGAWWALVGTCLLIATMALLVFVLLRGRHAATGGLPAQVSALLITLAVLLGVAAVGTLAARRTIPSAAVPVLLTGLVALELLHQGMRLYRFYSPADLYPATPLIRYLQSRPLPYRIVGDGGALFPNTNVFALAESIGTHDPTERRDYVEILDLTAGYPPFDYFKAIRDLDAPILDFLNTRYLIASAGRQPPGQKWRTVYSGYDGTILENQDVLPRFFSPARVRLVAPVPGRDPRINALAAFGQPLRDLLKQGSLRDDALVLGLDGQALGQIANGPVLVSDLEESTNRIRFHVSVATGVAQAILVSSVVSDGGWSARDDAGRAIPVGLANGPFLALALSPGTRMVTLTYLPPGLRGAAVLSLASLILTVGYLSYQRRASPL